MLTLWFRNQPELNQPEPVYARTQVPHEAVVVVPSTPVPERAPEPQVVPSVAVMKEDAPPAPAEAVPEAAAPVPAPEPEVPTAPPATATKVPAPAPSVAPLVEAPPDFRLNGIIYSSVPSAIVNGRMVKVGDQVNGATVVAIEQTNVTLQVNGQRKTYALR
jgi:hypothetical protein